MATPGIKFDDGTGGFVTNCFPVRTLISQNDETSSGAWLTAQRAEQRRRFKALICSKPRTYDQIRNERKKAEKNDTEIIPPYTGSDDEEEDTKALDGFFLMTHCCVEDPADLCSVNISGQGLSEVKEEDLQLFDSVAYVNASENILPLEPFKSFPILRELEMSLNGLRGFKLQSSDFTSLEMLDLSYNNLSSDDVLPLGLIPNLKILHLTGNSLKTLPADMARPHLDEQTFERVARYKHLEILLLEDNKLSDQVIFAALAGLRRLKHLDLSKNQIHSVPQLLLLEGKHVTQEPEAKKKHGRHSRPSSRRSNRSGRSTADTKSPSKSNGNLDTETEQSQKEAAASGSKDGLDLVLSSTSIGGLAGDRGPDNVQSSVIVEQEEDGDLTGMQNLGDLGTLSDLKLDELNLDEMTQNIMDSMPGSKSNTKVGTDGDAFERPGDGDLPLPPPFPELRHLNLAHNKISAEESLLPVAAWPMLTELVIHDNPLTVHNAGDPPLLKRFLQDRLGISIQRRRQDDPLKPHIEVPVKPERKVVTKILPVPRCNVQELLALEAPKTRSIQGTPETTPKQTPQSTPQVTARTATLLSMERTTPLPPIPASQEGSTDQAFFMTQVDEAGNEIPVETQPPEHSPDDVVTSKTTQRRRLPQNTKMYRGYEALLDNDQSTTADDIPMPKDLPGNIRALQYALAHPLVFRDNPQDLQVPQPPYRPLVKHKPVAASRPRRNKAEQFDAALIHLKNRSTVVEMDLKTVLEKKKSFQKDFSEADQLLGKGLVRSKRSTRITSDKLRRQVSRKKSVNPALQPSKSPDPPTSESPPPGIDGPRAGIVLSSASVSRLSNDERIIMHKSFDYWMEKWNWLFVGKLLSCD